MVARGRQVDGSGDPEAALREVTAAALFAATYHGGRFADGTIENIALDIGLRTGEQSTGTTPRPKIDADRRRRVLHVVSRVLGVGGHTRMIHHWIANDASSVHSLVATGQGTHDIPSWLAGTIQRNSGMLQVFPQDMKLMRKAASLRQLARDHADLVVLHHDCCDVVPVVAFAQEGGPPVAILDHADHLFWLGSSVADTVIGLRSTACMHATQRRFATATHLLPIPLAPPPASLSRAEARRRLGMSDRQTVLLSVGRPLKYRPCGAHDFVSTAGRILARQPSAHLFVVGETLEGIRPYLRSEPHPRLHFEGSTDDTSSYRAAADIYLESFPFGSNTALLEAALGGLPVVPAWAPLFRLLVAGNDSLDDVLTVADNEDDYIERVVTLIERPAERQALGGLLRSRLLDDHVGHGWLKRLHALYEHTDRLVHRPRPLPASSCDITEADMRLSLWNAVGDGSTTHGAFDIESTAAVLRHGAFVFKQAGDYRQARRLAWKALCCDVASVDSWRLLAVTLVGKSGRWLRDRVGRDR
jgi:glycosyltransferase involved in cell wall biosynthesis